MLVFGLCCSHTLQFKWIRWVFCYMKLLPSPESGAIKHNHLNKELQYSYSFHLIARAGSPSLSSSRHHHHQSAHPPLSLCSDKSLCTHCMMCEFMCVCVWLCGCEDSIVIRYQLSLPCFNTEQKNRIHAISLKEGNCGEEGGRGVRWGGWKVGCWEKCP